MRPLPALAACVALALLGAGCASTPPRLYRLSASNASSAPAPAAAASAPATLAVGPVTVPAQVDRPQIVLDAGANQVRVDEFSRWAAPLADNITGVLVTNLAQRLPATDVWAYADTARPAAELSVVVQVQRFDIVPGDAALLDAVWSVQPAAGAPRRGQSRVREPIDGSGIDAAVAAQSRALARVSDDIARAVRGP